MFLFLLKELFFLFITFIDYDCSIKEQYIKASGRVLNFFVKNFPSLIPKCIFSCISDAAVINSADFLLEGMFSVLTSSQ